MGLFVTQIFIRVRTDDDTWENLDLIDPRVTGLEAQRVIRGWTNAKSLQTLVMQLAGMCRIYLNKGKS